MANKLVKLFYIMFFLHVTSIYTKAVFICEHCNEYDLHESKRCLTWSTIVDKNIFVLSMVFQYITGSFIIDFKWSTII